MAKWSKVKLTFAARLINKNMMTLEEVPIAERENVKKRYKEMFGYPLYAEVIPDTDNENDN